MKSEAEIISLCDTLKEQLLQRFRLGSEIKVGMGFLSESNPVDSKPKQISRQGLRSYRFKYRTWQALGALPNAKVDDHLNVIKLDSASISTLSSFRNVGPNGLSEIIKICFDHNIPITT